MSVQLSFDPKDNLNPDFDKEAKIAILREQGVNSHLEMVAAFIKAGFLAVDVHMSDIISKKVSLKDFNGLVACGGFYGDVPVPEKDGQPFSLTTMSVMSLKPSSIVKIPSH